MMHFFISIAAFIVAIGILVVFHEWGHFWVARRLGVKVLRFSVGFGKPLWRYQSKSGVEFTVCAIPLGGYVKMLDEREGPVPAECVSQAFNRQPVWRRFLIVLAGPLFNFLFAVLAYWLMLMIGVTSIVARIGDIAPNSIAYHAGLHVGEEIVQIDNVPTLSWQQVYRELLLRLGDHDKLKVVIKTPEGAKDTRWLDLKTWELQGDKPNPLHALGITPYQPPIPAIVDEVIGETPAAKAGFLPHDEIIAVAGKPVHDWQSFSHYVAPRANQSIAVTILRNGAPLTLTVIPRLKVADTGESVGFVGLIVKIPHVIPPDLLVKERAGPLAGLLEAVQRTQQNIQMTFHLIGKMIMGQIGVKHLSGPISIAEGAGTTAVLGLSEFLGFLALISISLGVLNLLPIPVLDGGHLLFYLIEGVMGRPVSEKVQLWGFKLGFIFLIFLMIIAFYNDLVRFL